MSFTPLVRTTLSEQIVNQIREAIGSGRYAAGAVLPSERELVRAFGASRVAVREALVALQAQGVIERAHGKAAQVAVPRAASAMTREVMHLPENPSENAVRDVKQARLLLEVEMARIAARIGTPADAERLRGALEANRKAISDSVTFLETDMAMHSLIASISGNALFAAMSRDMLGWLARFQSEAVHVEGSVMLSHREHAKIIEFVIEHDADGAAKAMHEHLSRSHLAYGRLHSQQALPAESALPTRAQS